MTDDALPTAAVALMKGVVYRDTQQETFAHVLRLQPQLRDHLAVLGLGVVTDETEGHAFLRALPEDPERPLPRLIPRHKLSLHTSVLLALLRRSLAEFDASTTEGRLVLERDRVVELMTPFLPATTNEARRSDQVDRALGKARELGFVRAVPRNPGAPPAWEVLRILKAFVDAQWLGELDARLAEYAEELGVADPGVRTSPETDPEPSRQQGAQP